MKTFRQIREAVVKRKPKKYKKSKSASDLYKVDFQPYSEVWEDLFNNPGGIETDDDDEMAEHVSNSFENILKSGKKIGVLPSNGSNPKAGWDAYLCHTKDDSILSMYEGSKQVYFFIDKNNPKITDRDNYPNQRSLSIIGYGNSKMTKLDLQDDTFQQHVWEANS